VSKLDEAKLLQNRTKAFAVRTIKAFARLPKDEAVRVIGRRFLRSVTSLAVCRARSAADGSNCWESELAKKNLVEPLMKECQELLKIFSASLATAKRNR
jgi:hypothetical protein